MDDALVLASTAVGNTEDVLVVASPSSGAQASNDNDVETVAGAPRAVAVEQRPHKKSKSNNGKPIKKKKKKKRNSSAHPSPIPT
jgi:hypothetical protein